MENLVLSLISAFIVSLISFVGIFILLKTLTTESRLVHILISFAAGALIGDAFIHLLPEYIEIYSYSDQLSLFIFIGIILMLVIESYFHSRHEHDSELIDDRRPFIARLNLLSDAFHNFLDGIAIGASFLINPGVGLATAIAIALHEIPQELADVAVLVYSGWKRRRILIANFLIALTGILGVLIVFISENIIEGIEQILLPVAIGQFLYISVASLVPEIHRQATVKRYLLAIIAFLVGITAMYALTLFE